MRIDWLEKGDDAVARWTDSGGEFFRQADGRVWYRDPYGQGAMLVASDEPSCRAGSEALNRYWADVVTVDANDEAGQMVFVRRLAEKLRQLGLVPAPAESFWSLMIEMAEHGML